MLSGNCYCGAKISYKINKGYNDGRCDNGHFSAYTWLSEHFEGIRVNPKLVPNFKHYGKKSRG